MEPGSPDVVNQLPATGNPMEPTSGTYGSVVETERLKQALNLPGEGPGPSGPGAAPPPPPGVPQGAPAPSPAAGLVPEALLRPTEQPHVPPSTPLGGPPPAPSPQGREARIQAFRALSQARNVSEATQAWAKEVLRVLGE
jgi:hypothetical protein